MLHKLLINAFTHGFIALHLNQGQDVFIKGFEDLGKLQREFSVKILFWYSFFITKEPKALRSVGS